MVVSLRDVGQRHALQTELDRQGAFAGAVVDNLVEGIIACDETGRLTLANQAVLDLFGLNESPVGRDDWATIFPAIYLDGERSHTCGGPAADQGAPR